MTLLSCLKIFHVCACSGSRTRGVRVRYLTNSRSTFLRFVVRSWPNKHVHGPVKGLTKACRSSHTDAWTLAVIRGVESDAKRGEEYPAENVKMDSHNKNLEHPKRSCFVVLCQLTTTKQRSKLRVNSSVPFARIREVTGLRSWQIRTSHSIKVSEMFFLC